MTEKLSQGFMVCPCCGHPREVSSLECRSCGARQVGEPLAPPDFLMPKQGTAIVALVCSIAMVAAFLALWVFGNDMKVGRALLVLILGDSYQLTNGLLKVDPKLPYYRIFSYDAYRTAFTLSFAVIPLSLLVIWMAQRAARQAAMKPALFGGASMARISLVMSTALLTIFGTVAISAIPQAIANGKARRLAATRAAMYELHQQALQKYYKEYGSYPQDLIDLSRVNAETTPQTDYWKQNLSYQPVGVIASRGAAISFSNYKLVSAGPDGQLGTEDDITMVDGVIIDGQDNSDLPKVIITPENSRR